MRETFLTPTYRCTDSWRKIQIHSFKKQNTVFYLKYAGRQVIRQQIKSSSIVSNGMGVPTSLNLTKNWRSNILWLFILLKKMVIDWNVYILSRQHSHRRSRMTELCHIISWYKSSFICFISEKDSYCKALTLHRQHTVLVFLSPLFCAVLHHLWVWLCGINITQAGTFSVSFWKTACSKTAPL